MQCCCSRAHPLWATIIGQPCNSIIICRVQLGQATSQLCQRTGIDDVRHRLWLSTGTQVRVGLSPSLPTSTKWPCAVWKRFRRDHCHRGRLKLVSWSSTSLFSTNMAISETKGQGWRVILTQWRKASDILTSTLATFLPRFSRLLQPPA